MVEDGSEIIRVPLREPAFVRAAFDKTHNIARTNVP